MDSLTLGSCLPPPSSEVVHRQTQNQQPGAGLGGRGAATETLSFLLHWEHVGGDLASSINGLQILFELLQPFQKGNLQAQTYLGSLSTHPSMEAGVRLEECRVLAHRWQYLYCEQALWECACEHVSAMCASILFPGFFLWRIWSCSRQGLG